MQIHIFILYDEIEKVVHSWENTLNKNPYRQLNEIFLQIKDHLTINSTYKLIVNRKNTKYHNYAHKKFIITTGDYGKYFPVYCKLIYNGGYKHGYAPINIGVVELSLDKMIDIIINEEYIVPNSVMDEIYAKKLINYSE